MLPRLQAQEQLDAISAATLGSGNAEQSERKDAIARLDAQRRGEETEPARSEQSQVSDLASDLAGMGIGFELVEKGTPSDG
ncbi:MAG: hypothetical protein AAF707_00070 [Pseudomonadota bacterium]